MGTCQKKISIKNWSEDDRPREKMIAKGRESLSDAELIAILINSGNSSESAVELSRRILGDKSNRLTALSRMSIKEMTSYKGIGEAKAISIVAALELGRRLRTETVEQKSIHGSEDAFELFSKHISDLTHEQFWILLLDSANHHVKSEKISEGGLDSTVVDTRVIFGKAIENKAVAIILGHNHPSGNITPSEKDKNLTHTVIEAGKILNIKILDHIIIGNNKYFSFADEGLL